MSGIYSALGRIGRDAEVRQTQNGTAVAGFPIAVDVGYGDNKTTLWLDASLWGKRAESGLVQYLVKGQQVFVTGELGTRKFQKRDGSAGFAVTLRVSELDLAGGSPQQGQPQQPQSQSMGQQGAALYGGQQPRKPGQSNSQGFQGNGQPYGQQQGANPGAPNTGGFGDFDDEIPFRQMHNMAGG